MKLGNRYPFRDQGWPDVQAFLASVDWGDHPQYPLEIVDSVMASGAARYLAVATSMHDLIVAIKPVGGPPVDVIAVRAPGSIRTHPAGTVLIQFVSSVGKVTQSVRPADEAVALFWRFVETEFGLRP
jgi:hypothetical protein